MADQFDPAEFAAAAPKPPPPPDSGGGFDANEFAAAKPAGPMWDPDEGVQDDPLTQVGREIAHAGSAALHAMFPPTPKAPEPGTRRRVKDFPQVGPGVTGLPELAASPITGVVRAGGAPLIQSLDVPMRWATRKMFGENVPLPPELTHEQAASKAEELFGEGVGSRAGLMRRPPPIPPAPTLQGEVLPPEPVPPPASPVGPTGPIIEHEPTVRENGARLLPPEAPHALPEPARAGVGAAGTPGRGPLSDISPQAQDFVRKQLEAEGYTADPMGRSSMAQRDEAMSSHQTLAEVTPGMEANFGGLATHPGQSRSIIENTLNSRAEEAPARFRALANRTIGNYQDMQDLQRSMEIERGRVATPLYDAFRRLPIPPTQALNDLIPRLEAAGAFANARRLAAVQGRPWQDVFTPESGVEQQFPTGETWDLVKRAVDTQIEESTRAGSRNWTRVYTQLKNDLIDALDNHPDQRIGEAYRQARESFATPTELLNAQQLGRDVLTDKVHREELPYLTASYSAAQMRNLRIGLRADLEDRAGRSRSPTRTTSSLLDAVLPESNQQKLRWVLGDEPADELIAGAQHEEAMHGAPTRIVYGAPTGARLTARDQFALQPTWLQGVETKDIPSLSQIPTLGVKKVLEKGQDLLRRNAEAKQATLRADIARIYTLQGNERTQALEQLLGGAEETGPIARPPVPPEPPEGGVSAIRRGVTERGRSGRPIKTEPLPIGTEQQILEQGYERAQTRAPPEEQTTEPYREPMARRRPEEPPPPPTEHVPLDSNPLERALTVNDILHPDYPALPARSRNVEEIAPELNNRGRDALRALGVKNGTIEGPAPHTDEVLSRSIASEIKAALGRGNSASDWYTRKMQEAMDIASTIHPELATDPAAKFGFTSALSITSQGETVASNVRLAHDVYTRFKETGRFPTDVRAKNGIAMNANFQKLNKLLDEGGPAKAQEFLNTEFTVKQLVDAGYDIGGENMGTKVYGSAILGPKIGGGFFQNLNGNYNPVTMDLWFMRAWGRMTGTLTGTADMAKPRARFVAALQGEGQAIPRTMPALEKKANEIVERHEKDFKDNRADYDSGDKTKSELTRSAERLVFNLRGLNETPKSGSQREWMRARVNRARELLGNEGIHVTNADLQAIWWYPEKELYAKMGGRDSEGINTDYASALRDLARKQGIPDEAVSRAIRPVDHGPGPAGTADVRAAEQGSRRQGNGPAGPQAHRADAGGAKPASPAKVKASKKPIEKSIGGAVPGYARGGRVPFGSVDPIARALRLAHRLAGA